MRDVVEGWGCPPEVWRVATVAAGFVVVALASRWLGATTGVVLPATPGFVVGFALSLGTVVVWGAMAGVVVLDLLTGNLALESGWRILVHVVIAVAAVRLWGRFGRFSSGEEPGVLERSNVTEYALVSLTTALLGGALRAWSGTLAGTAPFATVVGDAVLEVGLSALTVGLVACYLVPRIGRVARSQGSGRPGRNSPVSNEAPSTAGVRVLAIALVWTGSGLVLGIAFQTVQLQYPHVIVNQFGRVAARLVELSGTGGFTIQAVVGFVALACCAVLLAEGPATGGDEGS